MAQSELGNPFWNDRGKSTPSSYKVGGETKIMPKRLTASWLASLSDEEFAAVAQCVHSDAYGYWGKMNLRTAHDHQQAVFREQSIRTRRPPGGYSYQPANEGTLYTCTDCKATGLHQMDNVVHHAECIVFELDRRAEKRS